MEPLLLDGLQHNQVLLGPMTEDELRDVIVRPAQQAGVTVDVGLVELLLADLAPRSAPGFAHEAGALPLLSHALLATWERAQRNELTVADYRAAGGLRGAIRQSAEELYLDLGAAEQSLARRIFGRLVNVEDDVPFTRRRVTRPRARAAGRRVHGGARALRRRPLGHGRCHRGSGQPRGAPVRLAAPGRLAGRRPGRAFACTTSFPTTPTPGWRPGETRPSCSAALAWP